MTPLVLNMTTYVFSIQEMTSSVSVLKKRIILFVSPGQKTSAQIFSDQIDL